MRGDLLKRYNRFKKAIELLSTLSKTNPDKIVNDYTLLSSLERNIQLAVEFLIDLSNYILSESVGEVPDTYKEIVAKTGELCDLEKELIKEVRGIIGLRNIIVHLYADIDYDVILSELGNIIDEILAYVSKLFECIDKRGLDP